jgi:hypothetical protein
VEERGRKRNGRGARAGILLQLHQLPSPAEVTTACSPGPRCSLCCCYREVPEEPLLPPLAPPELDPLLPLPELPELEPLPPELDPGLLELPLLLPLCLRHC